MIRKLNKKDKTILLVKSIGSRCSGCGCELLFDSVANKACCKNISCNGNTITPADMDTINSLNECAIDVHGDFVPVDSVKQLKDSVIITVDIKCDKHVSPKTISKMSLVIKDSLLFATKKFDNICITAEDILTLTWTLTKLGVA